MTRQLYTTDREGWKELARVHMRTRVLPLDLQRPGPRQQQRWVFTQRRRLRALTDSSGVTAATDNVTPGQGTVTLYKGGPSAFELTDATQTAYNDSTTAVAANTVVHLEWMFSGWFVVWEDC